MEESERDAASDAKSANNELRLEESERDTDWTMPPIAWLRDEASDMEAESDAKSANSELRDEDSEREADSVIPAMA